MFIDGRFAPAASGATFDNINPATGKSLGGVAAGEQADIDRAVASARAAFRKGRGPTKSPKARKKVMLAFADLILANKEELALLETLDTGKPIGDSLAVDIPAAAHCIRWYAEAVDKIYDEVAPTGPRALATITREADGRRGRHRAVEFSAADGVVEDRPGARDGQLARAQAVGEVAADRAARRGARDGGGSARRRVQRRARASATRRARRSPRTWTSIASHSRARPRRARR